METRGLRLVVDSTQQTKDPLRKNCTAIATSSSGMLGEVDLGSFCRLKSKDHGFVGNARWDMTIASWTVGILGCFDHRNGEQTSNIRTVQVTQYPYRFVVCVHDFHDGLRISCLDRYGAGPGGATST